MDEEYLKYLETLNYQNLEKIRENTERNPSSFLKLETTFKEEQSSNSTDQLQKLLETYQRLYKVEFSNIMFNLFKIVDQIKEIPNQDLKSYIVNKYYKMLVNQIDNAIKIATEITDKEYLYKLSKELLMLKKGCQAKIDKIDTYLYSQFDSLHESFYNLLFDSKSDEEQNSKDSEIFDLKLESHPFYDYHKKTENEYDVYPGMLLSLVSLERAINSTSISDEVQKFFEKSEPDKKSFEKYYYVSIQDKEYGPYTESKIISLHKEGKVKDLTLVKHENELEWKNYIDFKELIYRI